MKQRSKQRCLSASLLETRGLRLKAPAHRLQHADAGCRTRYGLVLTVAALCSREVRHRVHPVLTQRCVTFCELNVNSR